ncbi:hypothetical protein [Streptomyces sp. NPDC049555]|uniref:hypothetical protein n=1 Tax=unclassified Streptomyces TaxID=2593676 RepID=UPI0034239705
MEPGFEEGPVTGRHAQQVAGGLGGQWRAEGGDEVRGRALFLDGVEEGVGDLLDARSQGVGVLGGEGGDQ